METVQLQCGNCQKLMAIAAEHLGGQVQCPHCQTVVQTMGPAPRDSPTMELDQHDSIFGGEVSEDVIGNGAASERTERLQPAAVPAAVLAAVAPPAEDTQADLTSFERPKLHGAGMGPLIIMIFLIPYAILMTLFVLYLVFVQARPHPLDMLPDPAPGKDKGAPRPVRMQTIHNHALAAHQKIRFGQSLQIGDLVVEPKQVRANQHDELTLVLSARNASLDTAFVPIDERFVLYTPRPDGGGKLYTFLESKSHQIENIYGGIPSYLDADGKEMDMHLLRPGEQATIGLLTTTNYKTHVKKIVATNDGYVWRVQLRRGFVLHRGKNVSATTVIGVEFTSNQIVRDAKKT